MRRIVKTGFFFSVISEKTHIFERPQVGYKETDEVIVEIRSHEVCAGCLSYGHHQPITSDGIA